MKPLIESAAAVENMFLSDSTAGLTNLPCSSFWRTVHSERDAELRKMRAFCCLVSLFIGARPSAWCRAKRRSWRSERATVALIFLDVLSRPTQSTGEVMEPVTIIAEQEAIRKQIGSFS